MQEPGWPRKTLRAQRGRHRHNSKWKGVGRTIDGSRCTGGECRNARIRRTMNSCSCQSPPHSSSSAPPYTLSPTPAEDAGNRGSKGMSAHVNTQPCGTNTREQEAGSVKWMGAGRCREVRLSASVTDAAWVWEAPSACMTSLRLERELVDTPAVLPSSSVAPGLGGLGMRRRLLLFGTASPSSLSDDGTASGLLLDMDGERSVDGATGGREEVAERARMLDPTLDLCFRIWATALSSWSAITLQLTSKRTSYLQVERGVHGFTANDARQ
jgi:hypothetical protein